MTTEQSNDVRRVRDKLREARTILDQVMYGGEGVNEKEYKRLREGYDLICAANDAMP